MTVYVYIPMDVCIFCVCVCGCVYFCVRFMPECCVDLAVAGTLLSLIEQQSKLFLSISSYRVFLCLSWPWVPSAFAEGLLAGTKGRLVLVCALAIQYLFSFE